QWRTAVQELIGGTSLPEPERVEAYGDGLEVAGLRFTVRHARATVPDRCCSSCRSTPTPTPTRPLPPPPPPRPRVPVATRPSWCSAVTSCSPGRSDGPTCPAATRR